MTAEEASAITLKIKANVRELASLIKQARDGQAWKALEFESFEHWVRESFGWHRSRAYQLISIATLDEELHELISLPGEWSVSDRQTRKITQIGSHEFLVALVGIAVEDPQINASLIDKLIRVMTNLVPDEMMAVIGPSAAPLVTQSSPSSISNGVRDSRTALVMASSLEQQSKAFPPAANVSPSVRIQVTAALQHTASEAKSRLEAFDRAVAERGLNRAANAN